MNDQRRLAGRRLATEPDERGPITFRRREERCANRFQIAFKLGPVRFDQRDHRLGIGIGHRVVNGAIERRPAPRAVDIGQHLALFDDLLAQRRRGLVMRTVIDEANYGEVRDQRQQAGEKRYSKGGRHSWLVAAQAASM